MPARYMRFHCCHGAETIRQADEQCLPQWLGGYCIDCLHADCAGGYNEEFRGKMRSVLYNLKDEKNQDFRGKVLRGEVTPTRICQMESHDMASEVLRLSLVDSPQASNQDLPQWTAMT